MIEDSFNVPDRLGHIDQRPLWGRGCIGLEKVDTLRHRGIEVRFPAGTRAALPTLHVEWANSAASRPGDMECWSRYGLDGFRCQEILAAGDGLLV